MARLAIIPARSGSKRIPGKNIKDFFGKPVIAYSIQAALDCGLFDEVMVSTDDLKIAEIAKAHGAQVPFLRSEKNSDDQATTLEVIKEVLNYYKTNLNKSFDQICCIYPAAPLINASQLKKGFEKLTSGKFDSVFPVVEFSYPVWRGMELYETGKVNFIWPEFLNSRSQDLKKVFHDAGQWYWMNVATIGNSVFTDNSSSIIMMEEEVQDIDNPSDWKLAELKYRMRNEA